MLICKYYRARDGSEPVRAFIQALPQEVRGRIRDHIGRLKAVGEDLDFPYTSQVQGELRELRASVGRRPFRIFYRRSRRFAVLLHIVEKRRRKVSTADISIADARYRDFKSRMDCGVRIRPRPLGSDAP
jgi:phage-related protein